MTRIRAVASGLTDVGRERDHNEDSFVVVPEHDLFVVADGMGGHRAGDVASRLAVETIAEFFRATAQEDVTWPFQFELSLSEEENRLVAGIRLANRQIFERSIRSRECAGMGTTVVGVHFAKRDGRLIVGHVGDSRCYRIRKGELKQLTRDHSLVNECLAAMPDLTPEQRAELPKNVITRALGMHDHVVVDLTSDRPEALDVYVLCSDGLSGMVQDDDILAIVKENLEGDLEDAPKRIADKLVTRANENGGEDNVTALVIRFELDGTAAEVEDKPTILEE